MSSHHESLKRRRTDNPPDHRDDDDDPFNFFRGIVFAIKWGIIIWSVIFLIIWLI